jgi:hypothetical protein
MTTHGTMRFRRCLTLAAVLALLGTFSLTPVTRADTGNVEVTAQVAEFSTALTLTLCDQSADFGSGLTASGDPVTSTDSVTPIPLNAGFPNGAFYRWYPSCDAGENFISVASNVSWDGTVCATVAGTSTSSLTLGDLRYSVDFPLDYSTISSSASSFSDCISPTAWTSQPQSTTPLTFDYFYYLQIDPTDTPGSFAATTTWEVTAS